MQFIRHQWTIFKSLGLFGVIILLIAGFVLWSAISFRMIFPSFNLAQEKLDNLNFLEDEVTFYLLRQETFASFYAASHGDPAYLAGYTEARAGLGQRLDEVQKNAGQYTPEEQLVITGLLDLNAQHQQSFERMKTALAAADPAEIGQAQTIYWDQSETLQKRLDDLIFMADRSHEALLQTVLIQARGAVLASVASLMALPLLGLWAFGLINRTTQPILALARAILTIPGNSFDRASLEEMAAQPTPFASLARALLRMAHAERQRQAQAEQELQTLKEQMHASRRQKRLTVLSK